MKKKLNRNVFSPPINIFMTVVITIFIGGSLFILSIVPYGLDKYNNDLYISTRDRGWDAVKMIKGDDIESVLLAKEAFDKNISRIKNIQIPFRVIHFLSKNIFTNEIKEKEMYILMYSDFSNGQYFKCWEDIAQKSVKRNQLYEDSIRKNKEISSFEYVNEKTKALTKEVYDINQQIDALDKEVSVLQRQGDNEYRDFTDRVVAFIERGIDIKPH